MGGICIRLAVLEPRSGPCSSTLGTPGGGLFTSQYIRSWHAMTSLSPFLRCLAARSCSLACITTRSHMWLIFLCS